VERTVIAAAQAPSVRMRPDTEFRALRELLIRRAFVEEAICERYSLQVINDFRTLREGREPGEIRDALDLLVRLFMDNVPVSTSVVRAHLNDDELDLLASFGLLAADPSVPDAARGTVLLYPVRSLFVISDSFHNADIKDSPEIVYPAITSNTYRFLATIPDTPCHSFLELCGGTGIAALVAARNGARRAVSTDITQRSTYFSQFNGRLNDLSSFSALQGDLYSPVTGQTFQRIACHPPYIPAVEQEFIYRDGGNDGEQITRRIFEDLWKFLDAGGRLYCTTVINELADQPAESRVRQMLGDRESEFDILVVTIVSRDPLEYFFKEARAGKEKYENLGRREQIITECGIQRMIYSSILVRRHTESRPPLTLRRQLSPRTRWQDFEWLLDIETAFQNENAVPALLYSRPRVIAGVRSRLEQVIEGSSWKYADCEFRTTVPFVAELKAPPWITKLLERMTGERTVHELFGEMQKAGVAPQDSVPDDFVRFVLFLARSGFVELPDFPLATRDARQDIR
jgi:methylase of polypeptide subunit release factors